MAKPKNSLYANINKKRRAGTSNTKKKSTISDKAYANMKAGFPNSAKNKAKRARRARGQLVAKTPAWQRKAGKSKSGGLNKKGVASYRRANPGSKLKTAVTTKPSKLKRGSKAANRRKSFCARMSGMKKRLTGAKRKRDPNSRINKSLRKWNC